MRRFPNELDTPDQGAYNRVVHGVLHIYEIYERVGQVARTRHSSGKQVLVQGDAPVALQEAPEDIKKFGQE